MEEGVKVDSLVGRPQGGILSPILSNIYLHELDSHVLEIIKEHHSTALDVTKINPKYDKITRRIQYLRDKYRDIKSRPDHIKLEIEKRIQERNAIPSRFPNGNRVRYVRYAFE